MRRSRNRRVALLAALGALLLANVTIVPVRALGFLFVVDTKGDHPDANLLDNQCEAADGTCSFRAAVMQANAVDPGTGSHEIRVNGATIAMDIENTAGDENAAAKGDYDILQNTRIVGNGAAVFVAGASLGNGLDRIFDIRGNDIDVEISGVTLRFGDANGDPGGAIRTIDGGTDVALEDVIIEKSGTNNIGVAIWTRGDLDITDSLIRDNEGRNGLIYAEGSANVRIRRSTISGNTMQFNGSALYLKGDAVALVDRSTISGNTTNTGGPIVVGIANVEDAALTLRNSTISGNTSNANNGAMITSAAEGVVTIESSTIGSNQGFGLDLDGPSSIKNTILAGNSRGNCAQDPTSAGHNLDTGTTCGLDGAGDIESGSPALGALKDNGGATLTRALGLSSEARDAGSGCPSVDQRGNSRPKDGDGDGTATCDIGAYEAAAVPVVATPVPTPVITAAPTAAPTMDPSPSALPSAAVTGAPAASAGASAPAGSVLPGGSTAPGSSAGAGPDASGLPVPSDSGGFLTSNLWLILAIILVVLVVVLFFVLRRRRPEQPPTS